MKENFSEKGYINHMALTGHTIIGTVLFAAYGLELFKGARTPGYFAVFSLLCLVPVIAEWLLYRKNPEDGKIMYIMGVGYGVLYMFAIYTTNSLLTCTYAFPMFMVIVLYMNVRFCLLSGGWVFLGNVICVVRDFATTGYAPKEIADVEIRLAAVLVTAAFMVLATVAVKKVNSVKMEKIGLQTREAKEAAGQVLSASGHMITDIERVAERMGTLGESMEQIKTSMNEISAGSLESADAISRQTQRTETIQQHIGSVKDTTAGIEENMRETARRVETGRQQMETLGRQVSDSAAASHRMQERMKELDANAQQMNTIIETITSVANSTGMLALNASIEASRAGEAGRGFAVVASEISALAKQTKTASANITGLIRRISEALFEVASAVDVVTENNEANEQSTRAVTENFLGIAQGTEAVGRQTGALMSAVESLALANADIVENIQTISAITEEVSAHAGETCSACEENAALVDSVTGMVYGLNSEAKKLQVHP